MLNNSEIWCEIEQPSTNASTKKTRNLYQKPRLEELGDLRTLTLGGSPGFGDSGGGGTCEDEGSGGTGVCP
jgi:hypothetical protein